MRLTIHLFHILFQPKSITHQCGAYRYGQIISQQNCNSSTSAKLTNPSASRNSKPIADALLTQVDRQKEGLQLLEIASGCGQHAGFLAPLLPNITFQPTEYDIRQFNSIKAYASDCPTKNILAPLFVDISKPIEEWENCGFQPDSYDYMLNCNMMHISPWACSVGLFRAAAKLLKPEGLLFTYGPYAIDGILTPESNVNFDASLKSRNPEWGVRDITDLKHLANANGIALTQVEIMPSNNKFLTWLKVKI